VNVIDKAIGFFAPERGLRRAQARKILAQYEAAEPSRQRKFRRDKQSINELVQRSASHLRTQARHLERNHDIARGALRVLVNCVVGPNGIGIEPQPRRADGSIHEAYAKALLEAYRDWERSPEVTRRFAWSRVQRMVCKAWLRDGECFAQRLAGPVRLLDHNTRVPYSLELLEADMVPSDYSSGTSVYQGIERNAWGQPTGYYVYKRGPDDRRMVSAADLKRVSADRMLHIACIDRIHQLRGVSEFASVITRLEDIKDYEESERVAAKIAAMLTAYVRKGQPDMYDTSAGSEPRTVALQPGQIIDGLQAGEEIGLIDSKRPNPNLLPFRSGQLKAVAAGLGGSYSSISRNYDGTFSSQRQELVEQWVHYAVLADDFVSQWVQPVWEEFVAVAHLSGVVPTPTDVVPGTENDALYVAQAMPWIDPLKEAVACETLVKAGFASEVEMIRRRGANPADVLEQISAWRAKCLEKGVAFTTSTAPDVLAALLAEQDLKP